MRFEVSKRTRVLARIGAISTLAAIPFSSLRGFGSDTLSWTLTAIGAVLGIIGYLTAKTVGTQSQLIAAEMQSDTLVLTYMSPISNITRTIPITDIRDIQLRDDVRRDSIHEPDFSISTVGPCIVIRYRDRKRKVLFATAPVPITTSWLGDFLEYLLERHCIAFYRMKARCSDDDVRAWIRQNCRTQESTEVGLEYRQRTQNSLLP